MHQQRLKSKKQLLLMKQSNLQRKRNKPRKTTIHPSAKTQIPARALVMHSEETDALEQSSSKQT